jgi:hypothetical protein
MIFWQENIPIVVTLKLNLLRRKLWMLRYVMGDRWLCQKKNAYFPTKKYFRNNSVNANLCRRCFHFDALT